MQHVKASQLSLVLLFLSACISISAQSQEGWVQSASSLLRRVFVDKSQTGESLLSQDLTTATRRLGPQCECEAVIINFDTTADGVPLAPGMYVGTEWAKYGLTLSASGGFGPLPRLFDSSDPVADRDLGAPNNRCSNPGPGVGAGGEPGTEGENCEPLGNVLIIQEDNDDPSIPDDQRGGGKVTFTFDEPVVYFHQIGLLDIDKPDSTMRAKLDSRKRLLQFRNSATIRIRLLRLMLRM